MNNKFDELAKGLAQSVTRRGALKKFGLDLAGIACSTGSACSSGSLLPSPVLNACRLGSVPATTSVSLHFSGPEIGRNGSALFQRCTPLARFNPRSRLSSDTESASPRDGALACGDGPPIATSTPATIAAVEMTMRRITASRRVHLAPPRFALRRAAPQILVMRRIAVQCGALIDRQAPMVLPLPDSVKVAHGRLRTDPA